MTLGGNAMPLFHVDDRDDEHMSGKGKKIRYMCLFLLM